MTPTTVAAIQIAAALEAARPRDMFASEREAIVRMKAKLGALLADADADVGA